MTMPPNQRSDPEKMEDEQNDFETLLPQKDNIDVNDKSRRHCNISDLFPQQSLARSRDIIIIALLTIYGIMYMTNNVPNFHYVLSSKSATTTTSTAYVCDTPTPPILPNPGKTVLVTGAAGFIGMHTSLKLKDLGYTVIAYDNMNDYYSVQLKQKRVQLLRSNKIEFVEGDVCNDALLSDTLARHNVDRVVHLAAQAGVRYSLVDPHAYTRANVDCFVSIMETFVKSGLVERGPLVYASSSSVYGFSRDVPFRESAVAVDQPASLYAATKRSDELMAHTYHHLYGVKSVGLRFFTVYGPWGRPDMAPFIFTGKISNGEEIQLNNYGKSVRDFTYVDDVVEGIILSLLYDVETTDIINLGGNRPVELNYFLEQIEQGLGKKANAKLVPMQKGDVPMTYADTSKAKCLLGWEPKTSIEEGMAKFVRWFQKNRATRWMGTKGR